MIEFKQVPNNSYEEEEEEEVDYMREYHIEFVIKNSDALYILMKKFGEHTTYIDNSITTKILDTFFTQQELIDIYIYMINY